MRTFRFIALVLIFTLILPCLGFAYEQSESLSYGYTVNQTYYTKDTLEVKFTKFISSPLISSLLLTIALVGLVVEILVPGFGIAGIISIIGFGLFFGGNIFAGNSGWASLILFVVGLILLIIEAIVPGFGLPGISGIAFMLIGIVLAMNSLIAAIFSISIAIIITSIIGVILFKRGFETKLFKSIVLTSEHKTEKGYTSSGINEDLISKRGLTVSELRPSGFIEIEGKRLDVLSEEGFIVNDTQVEVTRIEGSKIFVRRV